MARKNGSEFLQQTAVIPAYKDLFGQEATLDDLIGILKKYPVAEWLSYLGRMQNILSGTNAEDTKHIHAILFGTVSRQLHNGLQELERKHHGRMLLYYERQMSTLQQLAILHAPEKGTTTLDDEKGRHDLTVALLMTRDVMDADRPLGSTSETLLPAVLHDQIRMSTTPSVQYAARAFCFYELGQAQREAHVTKYLDLFQAATNVDAADCILGGLDVVAREESLSLDKVANAWYAIPQGDNPEEKRVLDAYKAVRMKSLAELKVLIDYWEGGRPVRDWNLIALSQAPICDLGDRGAFVLNHTALGRSLFDSVRHAVLTAALEKRLPEPYRDHQAIGGLYGELFESYIRSIFADAYPETVCRISEDPSNRRADFLVWFPDKVVVVEVKGVHFVGKKHASFLSVDERRQELEQIGMPHALEQLESTIRALRAGEIKYAAQTENGVKPIMPSYDWTITPIIPVIITEEQMPQAPGCWATLYAPLCAGLDELTPAGPLGKLRLLNVGDVERLPALQMPDDFATMLIRWGADPSLRDLSWSSFLATQAASCQGSFMIRRFVDMLKFLAQRLGLDETKIGCVQHDKAANARQNQSICGIDDMEME